MGSGRVCGNQRAMADWFYLKARSSDSIYLFAELSVGSATVPIWMGWTWMYTTLADFNVGRSVAAGGRGGGVLVPGSCSRTTLFFYCLRDVGEAARRYFFFSGGWSAWDPGCGSVLPTKGSIMQWMPCCQWGVWCLTGGCYASDTRRTPSH